MSNDRKYKVSWEDMKARMDSEYDRKKRRKEIEEFKRQKYTDEDVQKIIDDNKRRCAEMMVREAEFVKNNPDKTLVRSFDPSIETMKSINRVRLANELLERVCIKHGK